MEPIYEYRYDSEWARYIHTSVQLEREHRHRMRLLHKAEQMTPEENLDQHFNDLRSNK